MKTDAKTYIGQPLVQGALVLGKLESRTKTIQFLSSNIRKRNSIAARAGIVSSIRKSALKKYNVAG